MTERNPYQHRYEKSGYYWGKQPSESCRNLLRFITSPPERPLQLLDIGCGEGQNAVHFAVNGFEVTGVDISPAGLEKMTPLAAEHGVEVRTICADIADWAPNTMYDVLFSTGTLHYLPRAIRGEKFRQYREATTEGGVHALSVFVEKPFIARAPDADEAAELFRSGELLGYYWDWEVLFSTEEYFDCMSSGIPHRHAVNRIIARKR